VAVFAFHSPEYVSAALVVSVLILYLLGVLYFARKHNVKWAGNFIYIIILIACFYATAFLIEKAWLSCIAYAAAYIIVTLIFFRNYLHRKKAD